MYRLEVRFQNLTMKEYIPQKERTLTVGRHRDNDIVLRDNSVSRHHACFTKEGENLVVTDKGSKNGTIVNGLRVESVRLEDGDVIRIGDNLVIVVNVSSDSEAEATVTGEHVKRSIVQNASGRTAT
jgi:pSer/pThr/pTyr-binding forkhead associated (FHA) protein